MKEKHGLDLQYGFVCGAGIIRRRLFHSKMLACKYSKGIEIVMEYLFKLDPENPVNYALISIFYVCMFEGEGGGNCHY